MRHRLLPWVGRPYPDARLALLARLSVADDPRLADVTCVRITSAHGVIRLTGRVPHASDKVRLEATVRDALAKAGLPYASLVNTLQASAAGAQPALADQPTSLVPHRGVP